MKFPLNVYLPACAAAFLVSLASLPLWRRFCVRAGLIDDPGHRKIHATPIPLAGGFAVLSGILVPLVAGALAVAGVAPGGGSLGEFFARHGLVPAHRLVEMAAIAFGAAGMLALGALDDKFELRPASKFAGQFLIALLTAAAGVRITLFVHNLFFSYALTILSILTVINAFNFMDNMNGLCAGLGAIGAAAFAAIAILDHQYLVALTALLVSGALLGFLPHNFPRARAFLGDAGSHLTGYLLAVMAILPHFYSRAHPHPWAVLAPLLILAVPLGDLVCVVLIRWRLGQPFYVGDNNHLSHRLVKRGLSRRDAVLLIWLLALLAAAAGLFVAVGQRG